MYEQQYYLIHYLQECILNAWHNYSLYYKNWRNSSIYTEAGVQVTSIQGACPDSWAAFGASCYRYFPPNAAAQNWTAAQQVCQDNGAQLVEISSVYEDGFVQSLVGNVAPNGYWIGLADTKVHSHFSWNIPTKSSSCNFYNFYHHFQSFL